MPQQREELRNAHVDLEANTGPVGRADLTKHADKKFKLYMSMVRQKLHMQGPWNQLGCKLETRRRTRSPRGERGVAVHSPRQSVNSQAPYERSKKLSCRVLLDNRQQVAATTRKNQSREGANKHQQYLDRKKNCLNHNAWDHAVPILNTSSSKPENTHENTLGETQVATKRKITHFHCFSYLGRCLGFRKCFFLGALKGFVLRAGPNDPNTALQTIHVANLDSDPQVLAASVTARQVSVSICLHISC